MMENDILFGDITAFENEVKEEWLAHYGVSVASGRYPLGTGEKAYERQKNFRTTYNELMRKFNGDQAAVAKHLQFKSTTELRAALSQAKENTHAWEVHLAWKLSNNRKMSNVAIAERMFGDPKKESTVRNLLKEANMPKTKALEATMDTLKEALKEHPYLQVGDGVELYLGISDTRLKNACNLLAKEEGYKVHNIQVEQMGTIPGQKTTVKVLTKDDLNDHDSYLQAKEHLSEVAIPGYFSEDNGQTYKEIKPPVSIDSKRILVRYAEDGGTDKDGVIEIRPGVKDLSMGNANYAQVRIAVDDKAYMKGMAIYSPDIPDGYDVIYNSNKHKGVAPLFKDPDNPNEPVFKKLKDDPANPFGSALKDDDKLILARQRDWVDENGIEHRSAVNVVNEEGTWADWSKTISAQMLSKQPPALAKRQLDLTYDIKREEFDDIMALTNPVVKKSMLEDFAESCDAAAVHLKAHGFPGQGTHVILPMPDLPENQIYAPNFENGSQVVLIRYPHASIKEIPMLNVNNNTPIAKKMFSDRPPIDAVGISPKVAGHLSGADFDGDTVLVIPYNGDIRHDKYFSELKNFDPKEAYPKYEGMKKMTAKQKGKEMGIVTNLITDMTVQRAPEEELVRAIKHSMVVIDAEKHELDWKRSERENGILELKQKYQQREDGKFGGSTTLFSRASGEARVDYRDMWNYQNNAIDPETGKKIYTSKKGTYNKPIKDKKGNIVGWKEEKRQTVTTQMDATDDARTLISKYNTQIERVYADYANKMKAMANEARKVWLGIKGTKMSLAAKQEYAAERASLNEKLKEAKKNRPLERMAQILTNVAVKEYLFQHPEVTNDYDAVKKLKGRTLQQKRQVVGASKNYVTFTDREWQAVQAGAVSDDVFRQLLKNAKSEHVKSLATPRERKSTLSTSKRARAQAMLAIGYSQAEVADALGVSKSLISDIARS